MTDSFDVFLGVSLDDLRAFSESPFARARSVDKDPIIASAAIWIVNAIEICDDRICYTKPIHISSDGLKSI